MSTPSRWNTSFVRVRRGDAWVWVHEGWESAAFSFLEDRPWTPRLVGGVPCFIASDNPFFDGETVVTPFEGQKWCVVWGDRWCRWYDDATNLDGHEDQPIYLARRSAGDRHTYLIVHGNRESQPFDFQIGYRIEKGEILCNRVVSPGPPLYVDWKRIDDRNQA